MSNTRSWTQLAEAYTYSCARFPGSLSAQLEWLFANGFTLRSLASALSKDISACTAVAARSYTHPNSFDKIVLFAPRAELPSLRLHLWWPTDEARQSEQIHNHAWHFASHVLSGSLRFVMYEPSATGSSFSEVRATSPRSAGENYRHEVIGQARLGCAFDGVVPAGTHYFLCSETPHRVVAQEVFTATLMLQASSTKDHSTVYLRKSDSRETDIVVPRFTSAELHDRLEVLINDDTR